MGGYGPGPLPSPHTCHLAIPSGGFPQGSPGDASCTLPSLLCFTHDALCHAASSATSHSSFTSVIAACSWRDCQRQLLCIVVGGGGLAEVMWHVIGNRWWMINDDAEGLLRETGSSKACKRARGVVAVSTSIVALLCRCSRTALLGTHRLARHGWPCQRCSCRVEMYKGHWTLQSADSPGCADAW